MNDEKSWLCERIERLRAVLRGITDEQAVAALEQLLKEAEARLAEITAAEKSSC